MNVDIGKIDLQSKSVIALIVITTPMWYYALSQFHSEYFNSQELWMPIILAFCISVAWVSANILSSFSFIVLINPSTETAEDFLKNDHKKSMAWGMIYLSSTLWMGLIIFNCHLVGGNIYWLMFTSLGCIIGRLVTNFILGVGEQKQMKKRKQQQQEPPQ